MYQIITRTYIHWRLEIEKLQLEIIEFK